MNKDVNSHGATKKQNKTILNKAPGEFVKLLERKLGYIDKELIKNKKVKSSCSEKEFIKIINKNQHKAGL